MTFAVTFAGPLQTYVHFPPTSGQVEEDRYFEFPECLEVIAEAFAWKLFEGILITLRRLLHLPLLLGHAERSRVSLTSEGNNERGSEQVHKQRQTLTCSCQKKC